MTADAWPDLRGLLPPPVRGVLDEAAAREHLEAERLAVLALVVRAIAEAWDSGRLAAPSGGLPHEREVVGLLGVRQGLATERLVEAESALVAALADARERGGPGRPLDVMVAEFGLSPLAQLVLMLVAAAQLWGEVAQLYAILAAAPSRPVIDEHLVRAILGERASSHAIAAELAPDRPLVRFGLVRVAADGPRPFAALSAHPLVLARLRGTPLARDPEGRLEVVEVDGDLGGLQLAPGVAERLCAVLAPAPNTPTRLVLRGRPGSGRRTVLATLAAHARRRLAIVRLEREHLDDHARPTAGDLARALERCAIAGWIPCLQAEDLAASRTGEGDDAGAARAHDAKLQHVLDAFPGPIMVRAGDDDALVLTPGYAEVRLPALDEAARAAVWRAALTRAGLRAGELGDVAARWRVGAGTIHRVSQRLAGQVAPGAQPTEAQVSEQVSQHLAGRLGDVAECVRVLPRLADVVLPADIADSMREFQARIRLQRQVFETWGMAQVATTGRGLTALLQGPPGTGKTMVAGALARELGLELYRVDLSRIMSKWIGETERNLARVFAAAEQSQAIVLFDEADSLFSKRTEVRSSNDRFANLEVNYLLQRLDSFLGVVILTTNFGTAIDPAFRRRLSFRITFPVPDEDLREQLWRAHLPASLPLADDVDLAELARRFALTGGSVRNCALRAAFLAASEGAQVGQAHLLRAVNVEYRSVGKLTDGGALE